VIYADLKRKVWGWRFGRFFSVEGLFRMSRGMLSSIRESERSRRFHPQSVKMTNGPVGSDRDGKV
jgi:hypothetical protein